MRYISSFSDALAKSANGNTIITTVTVMLFYICVNMVSAQVETLIWGERFEHFLDPVLAVAFIAFAVRVVYSCAELNSK